MVSSSLTLTHMTSPLDTELPEGQGYGIPTVQVVLGTCSTNVELKE